MGKVVEIGITSIKGNQIKNVNKVEALKGKGLKNDRKFTENNQKERQITLIAIENINYFNNILLSLMDKIIELGLDNSENVCFINFDEKRKDGVNISTDDFSVNINNDIIIDNINYGYNTFKEFLNKKIENIKSVDNTQ